MNTLDNRFGPELYEVYIARAQAERAAYLARLVSRVPGLWRKLFHRAPDRKLGATRAMATAYGAKC